MKPRRRFLTIQVIRRKLAFYTVGWAVFVVPRIQTKIRHMSAIVGSRCILIVTAANPEIISTKISGFLRLGQAYLGVLSQGIKQPCGPALGRTNSYKINLERGGHLVPPSGSRLTKIFLMRWLWCAVTMRQGIGIEVSSTDRGRVETIVADRNSPSKHVRQARIIRAIGQGCGTPAGSSVGRRASMRASSRPPYGSPRRSSGLS